MTRSTGGGSIGAQRLRHVLEAFRDTGVITGECKVDGPGTGQAAWCYSHGWGGVVQDCERDVGAGYSGYHCPLWRIAAWIARRHEYASLQESASS